MRESGHANHDARKMCAWRGGEGCEANEEHAPCGTTAMTEEGLGGVYILTNFMWHTLPDDPCTLLMFRFGQICS